MTTSERLSALSSGDVLEVLGRLVSAGADYADAFVEDTTLRKVAYSERRVTAVSSGYRYGVGIRFIRGGRQYLAHTSDVTIDGIQRSVDELLPLLGSSFDEDAAPRPVRVDIAAGIAARIAPPTSGRAIPADACIALIDAAADGANEAANCDGCDIDVEATRRGVRVINTAGIDETAISTRTELTVDCTIDQGTHLDNGRRNRGELGGPDEVSHDSAHRVGQLAGEQALSRATSVPAPTGEIDVIVAAGTAGVVFHETVGHGLEADLVQSFKSVYSGRVGTQVGDSRLVIVDDGTLRSGWGSAPIDDEGSPAAATTLLREGVLQGYLSDRATRGRAGGDLTANSRRAAYTDLPFVRMTNTIVEPGDTDPHDIIADTMLGILVTHLRGGGFNPGTGQFLFSTSEASLIENGRVVGPIRNATFLGSALSALMHVDAVGNDFELVAGGRCGKRNQTIPVGFGAPTIRMRQLTVGGR